MTRIAILHGRPDDEELAAIVVALTSVAPTAAADVEAAGPARTPAWVHAALLEGIGGPAVVRPADLARQPAAPRVRA